MIYIFALIGVILGGVIDLYFYQGKKKKIQCKRCEHKLSVKNLIPLVSYLADKGRCPHCKEKYSSMYFFIPLLNVYASVLLYKCFEDFYMALFFVCIHALIILLVVNDIRTKKVPTLCLVYLFLLGIGICLYQSEITLYERMIALCLGSVPLAVLSFIVKDTIGSGDYLFLGILGFIMGVEGILLIMVFSYFLASVYSFVLWIRKKAHRKMKIAMFPFFYMSMMFYLLYTPLIHQYFSIKLM